MLKKHGNDKDCIQECFRAIRNLAHCNKEIVEIFTELSVCELILDLINKYKNNNELCQWGWYVVTSLAITTDAVKIIGLGLALNDEHKPSKELQSICGCELVVETMVNYKQICSVIQWSAMALGRLASDKSNRILLGAVHSNIIYEILNQSLILHLDDEDVIEEVCYAIGNLVLNINNAICMNSVGVSVQLLNVLKLYKYNEVVSENALISISNMFLLNDSNINKSFVEAGICYRLPSTLTRLGVNVNIASYIYKVLYSLSTSDEYRIKLSSGNFIVTLIKSMTIHMKNIDILINIIRIISKLCWTEVSIQKLQLTNVCQVLINLLMIFRNKENINCSKKYLYLLELCLLSIGDLSINSDICRGNFLQFGGVEILIIIINLYFENKVIIINGCTAITNLSGGSNLSPSLLSNIYPLKQDISNNTNLDNNNNNNNNSSSSYLNNNISISSITNYASNSLATKISSKDLSKEICDHFSTLKISQLINNILKLHYNVEDVSISICQVIHSLSSNCNIRVRFGQTGINEAIMKCIPHHLEHAGFALIACNCIGSLSFHDDDDNYSHNNDITLGSLDACQLITQLLVKFTDSTTICLACCRAITHLSIRSDLNKIYFNDCQTIESILLCLKCHNNNISIIIHSFLAFGLLGFNNKDNCVKLVNNNVHLLILEYSTIYLYNDVVIEALFRCIYSLILILNDEFIEIGLIDIVSTMLTNHSYNIITSEWICKVINILAIINYSNRIHLIDKGVIGGIITLLDTFVGNESMFSSLMKDTTSLEISIVICNTIFNLLIDDDDDLSTNFIIHSNINSNAYNNIQSKGTKGKFILSHQKLFLNTNVIELIVKLFYKFSNSLLIGQASCRALFVLCVDNRKICTVLGNLGACQLVGETLHQFPSNEQVATWGSRCVYELVYKNSSNTYKMISNLVCEIIPVIIQTHQTSSMVCQIGCSIISTLTISIQDLTKRVSIDGNNSNIDYLELTSRFGQSGGCEAVLFALENHCNISVLNAFSNLSLVKGNSTYFGATDACTSLINCYNLYNKNETFCSAILEAIGNICIDNNNKEKILQIFSIEDIKQSKELHKDNKDVVKWANYTISRLTKIKTKIDKNTPNIQQVSPPTSPIIKISKKFLPKHNNNHNNDIDNNKEKNDSNNNDDENEINRQQLHNIEVSMKSNEDLIVNDYNNRSFEIKESKEIINEQLNKEINSEQKENIEVIVTIQEEVIDEIIDIIENNTEEIINDQLNKQEIIKDIPQGNNQKDILCQLYTEEEVNDIAIDQLELEIFNNDAIDEIRDNSGIVAANLSSNNYNSDGEDDIDDFLNSIE
jgi:hypothetical protein